MRLFLAVTTSLLLFPWCCRPILGQTTTTNCDSFTAKALALASIPDGCGGCPSIVSCTGCHQNFTTCSNGCLYCDRRRTVCGSYAYTAASNGTVYAWVHVALSNASAVFYDTVALITMVDGSCAVAVAGRPCRSCQPAICANGKVEHTIDCTNVQAGANVTACTHAADTATGVEPFFNPILNSVLGGLYFPFEGCADGVVVQTVLLPGAPTTTMTSVAPKNWSQLAKLWSGALLVAGATALFLN